MKSDEWPFNPTNDWILSETDGLAQNDGDRFKGCPFLEKILITEQKYFERHLKNSS